MKTITDELAAHLAQDTMTTARLWKLKRKATTEVLPVRSFSVGANISDPSCDQLEIPISSIQGPTGTLGGEEAVGTSYAVADLADNNTSAAGTWSNTTSGDAIPADTSKVSIKAALYPGATTRVLAHMVSWFNGGTNGHIDVGYSDYSGSGPYTANATQIAAALADMKSRGIDGVILDWYGQGTPSDAVAGAIKAACEADGAMTFAICIDKGLSGGLTQANFEAAVAYINTTYFGSFAYEKRSGRPLLLEFGCEQAAIDWTAVKTYMAGQGNPLFLWQDLTAPTGATGISGGSQNAFDAPYTDGVFSWVGVSAVTGGDPEALNYLQGFYNSAKARPGKIAMGSVRKGFNDALASWGSGRVMTQANGDTWADSFSTLNANFSSTAQIPYLQVVTWDDYEEGSEVETGIATNLAFGALSTSGNQVAWSTTGTLKPFDHIGVYASSDGGANYTFLGQVAKTALSVDLVAAFALAAGTYKIRLRAVGISSVQSVESADITVTVAGSGAATNDWEFVNGQWRTVAAFPANTETNWLYAFGFGFAIPDNATIAGIVCSFLMSAQQTPTSAIIQEVSLFNSQAPIGAEKTPGLPFTASQQQASVGSQSDLWGAPLTPALVNSSAFGFALRAFDDSVRLFISQMAMTVYYTIPAGGTLSVTAQGATRTVTQQATLILHTNFTGNQQADTSADALSGNAAQMVVDDDNTFYICSDYGASDTLQGQVRMFDASSGKYLGLLGTFPTGIGDGSSRQAGGGVFIINHPTRGKWLMISHGPAWGQGLQLMAIAAKDSTGAAIAPGTLTNQLTPMWNGISAGGNSGTIDVDDQGFIWVFGRDNGGTYLNVPRLQQIGFIGDAAIGVLQLDIDFGALYGWTDAYGVRFDPVSGKLVLWGANASGDIAIRADQNNNFGILASSTTLPVFSVPINIGPDGNYVIDSGTSFSKVQLSDLSVVQTQALADYGLTTTLDYCWYDAINNFAWLHDVNHAVNVVDLGNPGASGAAKLVDATDAASFSGSNRYISDQGLVVSPDGSFAVTQVWAGTPKVGFIDFWGTPPPQSAGITVNSVILGFTDHDQDIVYDDGSGDGPITYVARTGATFSAIESKPDMSVDNLNIDSFLESDLITEEDLRGGLYDDAECTIYLVNWQNLTQKHLTLRYGALGNVKIVNRNFTTEIRGLAYRLGLTIGDYYGPLCRAELFSTPENSPNRQWYCNLNAAKYQQNGTVLSSSDARHITPEAGLTSKGLSGAPAPAGWFDLGLITFTSGANQNLSFEIESWDGTTLTLEFPLYAPAEAGDTFLIEPGCDKRLTTCQNKFHNAVNHRGEPWIPGLDAVLDMFPSE